MRLYSTIPPAIALIRDHDTYYGLLSVGRRRIASLAGCVQYFGSEQTMHF